ncbi:MAG TPA: SRPBCC family protein [Ktedonobacterales bacterium]|nr:SRPBCC family protein [Ktedonobacterales bacterium]
METIECSIEIQRPVEVVFAYVIDPRTAPRWQAGVKEIRVIPEGPIAVGSKLKIVGAFLGVKLEGTNEVTAIEPNRSFSYTGRAGPATVEATYRFAATASGTRLSGSALIEPGGLFQVAGPLFASQAKKHVEADFRRLKALLETQPHQGNVA